MKKPPIAHGGQEHGELVAAEQVDQEGGADRRDRQTDTQDAGDQAALSGRDLIWQHRHLGGEQCVEEKLGDAPSDEDHRDARCQRDDEGAERTAEQTDDHPWPPHPQPRRGAIAHLAEERVREHSQQGADPGDECCLVPRACLARWAAALLAVGGIVTVALSVMPDAFYRLLALPNGIAMILLGYSLWRHQRQADERTVGTVEARLEHAAV